MKKIGILTHPLPDGGWGITTPYISHYSKFGEIKLIMDDEFDCSLDLLVLPGGPDVDTDRYGQKPNIKTGKPCPFREYFDKQILPLYFEYKTPVFGTCRAMQSIAVMYNASLHQHLPHETNPYNDRSKRMHSILYDIDGTTYVGSVNSIHHQVVSERDFPNELKIIARHCTSSKRKDGKRDIQYARYIEAFIHKELPIACVQYHPEDLGSEALADSLIIDLLSGNFNQNKYGEIPRKENVSIKGKVKEFFS